MSTKLTQEDLDHVGCDDSDYAHPTSLAAQWAKIAEWKTRVASLEVERDEARAEWQSACDRLAAQKPSMDALLESLAAKEVEIVRLRDALYLIKTERLPTFIWQIADAALKGNE